MIKIVVRLKHDVTVGEHSDEEPIIIPEGTEGVLNLDVDDLGNLFQPDHTYDVDFTNTYFSEWYMLGSDIEIARVDVQFDDCEIAIEPQKYAYVVRQKQLSTGEQADVSAFVKGKAEIEEKIRLKKNKENK